MKTKTANSRFDEFTAGWTKLPAERVRYMLPKCERLYARVRVEHGGADEPRRKETLRVIGIIAEGAARRVKAS